MKKTFLMMGMLLIAAIVYATLDINNAVFTPKQEDTTRYEGNVTFLCHKTPMSVYLNEGNLHIGDDFERAASLICQEQISDVVDWEGRTYKQTYIDGKIYRSFNESYLLSLR